MNDTQLKQHLEKLKSSETNDRQEAIQQLSTLEMVTDDVIKSLMECGIGDPEEHIRVEAIRALSEMSEHVDNKQQITSMLKQTLKDESVEVRNISLEAIENLGISDSEVVDCLVAMLSNSDEEEEIRESVCRILGFLNNPNPSVLGILIKSLSDECVEIRANAAQSLGLLGVGSDKVVEALERTAKDEEYVVRNEASKALKMLEKAGSYQFTKSDGSNISNSNNLTSNFSKSN